MNHFKVPETNNPEELLKELQKAVDIRDSMGGALYWNICNDDCCELAGICLSRGCNRLDLEKILGAGTFR